MLQSSSQAGRSRVSFVSLFSTTSFSFDLDTEHAKQEVNHFAERHGRGHLLSLILIGPLARRLSRHHHRLPFSATTA